MKLFIEMCSDFLNPVKLSLLSACADLPACVNKKNDCNSLDFKMNYKHFFLI